MPCGSFGYEVGCHFRGIGKIVCYAGEAVSLSPLRREEVEYHWAEVYWVTRSFFWVVCENMCFAVRASFNSLGIIMGIMLDSLSGQPIHWLKIGRSCLITSCKTVD